MITEHSRDFLAALSPYRVSSAPLEPDGTFLLEKLEPGTYTILITAIPQDGAYEDTSFTTTLVTVPVESDTTIELMLP